MDFKIYKIKNGNFCTEFINDDVLNNILDEIYKSINTLCSNKCITREDIEILCPNYFIENIIIINNHVHVVNYNTTLFGCKVINHYKNEIVIFNKEFPRFKKNPSIIINLDNKQK